MKRFKPMEKRIVTRRKTSNAIVGNETVIPIFLGWVRKLFCTILFLRVVLLAEGGDGYPVYPKDFVAAAEAFKSAPASDRYDVAARLMKTLPTTPVVGNKRPIDYKSRESRILTRKYSKPSFLLTDVEALRLLGAPSSTNLTSYNYLIQVKGTNNLQAFLLIEFHNGHAVSSVIY